EEAEKDPYVRFVVYGGDGTANEVLNGIMNSSHADTVQLKIVPTGTGNDFVRSLGESDRVEKIDVMRYNGRYALNIVNFGFDCAVVTKTQKYKKLPLVSGSFAYVLGVVDMFLRKLSHKFTIEYTDESGNINKFDEEFTLCAIANGKFYGGGFKAAPIADIKDGMLDLILVKKVTRPQLIKLIGSYKKGSHIDHASGTPAKGFEKVLISARSNLVKVSGLTYICADGEVESANEVEISVIPGAVNMVY
ncbi:MAG: hypothetical protein E7623_07095, partial [Ruminococcaceae bacterium]|nr:hypothetical protein [Oscillospiraceae bacterium]